MTSTPELQNMHTSLNLPKTQNTAANNPNHAWVLLAAILLSFWHPVIPLALVAMTLL